MRPKYVEATKDYFFSRLKCALFGFMYKYEYIQRMYRKLPYFPQSFEFGFRLPSFHLIYAHVSAPRRHHKSRGPLLISALSLYGADRAKFLDSLVHRRKLKIRGIQWRCSGSVNFRASHVVWAPVILSHSSLLRPTNFRHGTTSTETTQCHSLQKT